MTKNKTNQTILAAVNKLADPVKSTLGVKGRTVLFNDERGKPHCTKDGVTVARHVSSENMYEEMVIAVMREAAIKTMLSSGDGTTTTTILGQYLIQEGMKLLDEGLSYYELSKQMEEALRDVIKYVTAESIQIEKNPSLLREIAAVSSNDTLLGSFIYGIIEEIGLYGDIEVKASQFKETRVDKTKGMKLHKGWFETFMVNDHRTMSFIAQNCFVLLLDDTIRSMQDIIPYLELVKGEPLVVFCNDISDITLNQLKRVYETNRPKLCFVENDGFGDRKDILLDDLSALTSGYVVDCSAKADMGSLGRSSEIRADEMYTSVMGGFQDEEMMADIIEEIKESLEKDDEMDKTFLSNVDRRFNEKRLANLTGGIAVIHAGARTEMEMKELKDRLDDAVLAVSSSIRQGVNIGGGYTYINCCNKLTKKNNSKGYQLILNSLEQPFKQLLINAEMINEYRTIKGHLLKKKAIDLRNGKVYRLDQFEYKVYDPTSVLIDSIMNATAVSKTLLSTKTLMYNGVALDEG